MLLSFQLGLALYFLLRLTFQLLFQRQHFFVIKRLAMLWQNKERHREIVIFGHQPVVPDAEAESEPQAHLGIVQIVMIFVDGEVTDTAQFMENGKNAVINKRNLAQLAQQVMLAFTGRNIQQLTEMFRGGFAKHAHFDEGGVGVVGVVIFRRAGNGINEVVNAFQKNEVRFFHCFLSRS